MPVFILISDIEQVVHFVTNGIHEFGLTFPVILIVGKCGINCIPFLFSEIRTDDLKIGFSKFFIHEIIIHEIRPQWEISGQFGNRAGPSSRFSIRTNY